jgi:hypothetical protein
MRSDIKNICSSADVSSLVYGCSAYLHQAKVPAIPTIPVYASINILLSCKEPVL